MVVVGVLCYTYFVLMDFQGCVLKMIQFILFMLSLSGQEEKGEHCRSFSGKRMKEHRLVREGTSEAKSVLQMKRDRLQRKRMEMDTGIC